MRKWFVPLFILPTLLQAAVWDSSRSWNDEDEKDFNQWMKSPAVHKQMFVGSGSPYKGVVADCADVSYAFRVVYAFENGLDFKAKIPTATSRSKQRYFTQEMSMFDHIKDPTRKVVAFINYLGKSLGTETLVANDSYPLKLKSLSQGDVYLYKKQGSTGVIRHAYNIKDINEMGNFWLIYSTQAKRDNGEELSLRQKDLYTAPINFRWGFRRLFQPQQYEKSLETLKDYSLEQYDLAKSLGEKAFFKHVKKQIKTQDETLNAYFKRKLNEVCDQLIERVGVVQAGVSRARELNGACMEYADFDAHSTPSRDGRLKDLMGNIKLEYSELSSEERNELMTKTKDILNGAFALRPTTLEQDEMKNFCRIEYKAGTILDLKTIRERLEKNLLSTHPNDSLELRWGGAGAKTKCRAFY